MTKKFINIALCLSLILGGIPASANQYDFNIIGKPNKDIYETVKRLLRVPEGKVDFTDTLLTIDKIIDPSVNVFRQKNRMALMVNQIENLGNPQTNNEKKEALRRYLYEAGEWNNHQKFSYDFDDPRGTKIENKVITNYIEHKKGNCVSMPFLFIALGQQLGLDVTASNAPLHVFVKYRDKATGQVINLETTSGAKPIRDVWLRQQFPFSDKAISNGIYLKKLNKKQTVTVMATTVLEHLMDVGDYATVILLSHLLLEYNGSHISAILHLSSAHNELVKKYGLWEYHKPDEVPAEKRSIFNYLIPRVNWYHMKAEELGWRQSTPEEDEAYFVRVRKDAVK